jgi:hypothetical protein
MVQIRKYPRTAHIEGSRLQPGDEDINAIPFDELAGRHLVIEEKLDGANSAISFDGDGAMLLQSRGHYLTGGAREAHFAPLKAWAAGHRDALWEILGSRYIMYGEWLYAKHTVYYDALPHYFMEFDMLDRERGVFLATPERSRLLAGGPVTSVPVLREGRLARLDDMTLLIGHSLYKTSDWADSLKEEAVARGQDVALVRDQTDMSGEMEGLYIKAEDDGAVTGRWKFIRKSFLDAVQASGGHWHARPILPNGLAAGVSLFNETS